MAQLTGGQALVQSILRQGVETIFALPGVQLDWAFAALHEEREAIRVYHTRHEQATAYMADGYARATGRVGTCLVVPGPGVLNAAAALSTAYACSSPVLCLTGQIRSATIGKGLGELHEIPNQLELLGSVTKWAARGMSPGEIPGLVRAAFTQLLEGRPRPVAIEIPPDVLATTAEVQLLDPETAARASGDPDLLRRAAELLRGAERPLIFAGGGIHRAAAWEELRALAERLQAPVIMSGEGRGALSDRHPLAHPALGARFLLPQADVILAVGTRFAQPTMGGPLPSGARVIRLEIDPEEVARHVTPEVGIVGDAKAGLAELVALTDVARPRPSREAESLAVKEKVADLLFELQPQQAYTEAIRNALPDDGIVVGDMTQVAYFSLVGYPVYAPRTYVTPGYQGTLGYGYATALGAQVGQPGKKVVAVCGDGGFMYNVQELATAKQHNIPLVGIVFNDGAFGNVKRIQQRMLGAPLGSELQNPDFVRLAESFGVAGMRARTPEELAGVLREALATDGPVLIDVPIGEVPGIWGVMYPRISETPS